ncbi:MAG: helix-turn-helix domain-containing protein [Clostridia bacterium]|nr:helix-turn-helix domain-containing protein [Clostridia bacterium]
MRFYSGYYHKLGDVLFETEEKLLVASCGCIKFNKYLPFITNRPRGRNDFQIIYVTKGHLNFKIDGKNKCLKAGEIIAISPFTPQYYYISKNDFEATEYYWIHFLGTDAKTTVKHYGLENNVVKFIGLSQTIINIFDKIALELQLKEKFFLETNNAYLLQILGLISRKIDNGAVKSPSNIDILRDAVIYFNSNFSKKISLNDYVKDLNISLCWFTRIFKEKYTVSPRTYLTNLRIIKAKELLNTTSYSIGKIAELTGHENQLYFSRVFKKNVGITPSEYRKKS